MSAIPAIDDLIEYLGERKDVLERSLSSIDETREKLDQVRYAAETMKHSEDESVRDAAGLIHDYFSSPVLEEGRDEIAREKDYVSGAIEELKRIKTSSPAHESPAEAQERASEPAGEPNPYAGAKLGGPDEALTTKHDKFQYYTKILVKEYKRIWKATKSYADSDDFNTVLRRIKEDDNVYQKVLASKAAFDAAMSDLMDLGPEYVSDAVSKLKPPLMDRMKGFFERIGSGMYSDEDDGQEPYLDRGARAAA